MCLCWSGRGRTLPIGVPEITDTTMFKLRNCGCCIRMQLLLGRRSVAGIQCTLEHTTKVRQAHTEVADNLPTLHNETK